MNNPMEGFGAGSKILDSSSCGGVRPVKVTKYKNGVPVSVGMITREQIHDHIGLRKKELEVVTKNCPSCKKDYKTKKKEKLLCFDCQALKKEDWKRKKDQGKS